MTTKPADELKGLDMGQLAKFLADPNKHYDVEQLRGALMNVARAVHRLEGDLASENAPAVAAAWQN